MWLVTVNLWLLSRVLTKLILTVFLGCFMFLWRDGPLKLTPPFSQISSCVLFLCYYVHTDLGLFCVFLENWPLYPWLSLFWTLLCFKLICLHQLSFYQCSHGIYFSLLLLFNLPKLLFYFIWLSLTCGCGSHLKLLLT